MTQSNTAIFEKSAFLIITLSLLTRLFFINHTELLVEEAYYWNYAQHLDFGYLDHPPMVALLIKLSTLLGGTNEYSVRILSLMCWFGTAVFSFKLTEQIQPKSGLYAILLLSILPFFFLQSLVMTPDQPLTICWSAALYYLYGALVLNRTTNWYKAGVWLGLGLFSKYTIVLLAPSIIFYMLATPSLRPKLFQKEPYFCAIIALLFFAPVLYWNATHEWASFLFQSTRRLHASDTFSLHHLLGLILFFLMPPGLIGVWRLFNSHLLKKETRAFLQWFTLVPLVIFGLFSLRHEVKFNWIGPSFLALIPWFAAWIKNAATPNKSMSGWLPTAALLLIIYNTSLFIISFGVPNIIYQTLFKKFISWSSFTEDMHAIAEKIAKKNKTIPVFLPLDTYNIGSELCFYQQKLFHEGHIQSIYPIIGRHVFGGESLMYRYWNEKPTLKGKTLILISNNRQDFNNPLIPQNKIKSLSIHTLWSRSPSQNKPVTPYYYQIIKNFENIT